MSTISIVFALIILLFGFDPPKDEKISEISVFERLRKK